MGEDCACDVIGPAGALRVFGDHADLSDAGAFNALLKPCAKTEWVVYAIRPFAGRQQLLAYLARDTHRVAISNSHLVAFDGARVTFKVKDYRKDGEARYGVLTLDAPEFIRRRLSGRRTVRRRDRPRACAGRQAGR